MSAISDVLDGKYFFEPYFPEQRLAPSLLLIAEVEALIEVPVPEDVRAFLLRYGGTAPSIEKDNAPNVWIPGLSRHCLAEYLMGFFRSEPVPHFRRYDLRYMYEVSRHLIGSTFLPIMWGEGDNMYCLKLTGEAKWSIWAWLKDPVDINTKWEDIKDVWGLYCVAKDLLSFVRSFQETSECS